MRQRWMQKPPDAAGKPRRGPCPLGDALKKKRYVETGVMRRVRKGVAKTATACACVVLAVLSLHLCLVVEKVAFLFVP